VLEKKTIFTYPHRLAVNVNTTSRGEWASDVIIRDVCDTRGEKA
jgi:hypothetical protein